MCNNSRLLAVLLGLALVVATRGDYAAPGPYLAAWTEVTVSRTGGGTFAAKLVYPSTVGGSSGAFASAAAPCPAISFGHGFVQAVERYDSTLRHLATWGYVVIATRSQGSVFPDHDQYADDMRDCLSFLESQNATPATLLHQRIDVDALGMSGHSMGGGASILATARDARVQALANLAAANTNPSAIAEMPDVRVPVSLICGSGDTIVPVAANGQAMYNAGNAPRQLVVFSGGYHCGFIDSNTFGCDSGSMARAVQLELTRRELTAFFELYLRGDPGPAEVLWSDAGVDTRVQRTRDAGVTITPIASDATACAGATATLRYTITNQSPLATAFAVQVECDWAATPTQTITPTVAANTSSEIEIAITIPTGATPSESAAVRVCALRQADGGTIAQSTGIARRVAVTPGDLNRDGLVDLPDLATLLASFGSSSATDVEGDIDGDHDVDLADLATLLGNFGATCGV